MLGRGVYGWLDVSSPLSEEVEEKKKPLEARIVIEERGGAWF